MDLENKYLRIRYNSKNRWLSYWYQIHETMSFYPDNVLVIGKGSGITENSLRILSHKKISVVTLDINRIVNPDFAGEVTELPFKNSSFDVIVCCQVLEHIPFEKVPAALNELHRVVRKHVILSLPHRRKHIKLDISLPLLGRRLLILKHPFTKKFCSSKSHFWEIGRGVSLKKISKDVRKLFKIRKEYLHEMSCDQRFFILEK